MLLSAGMSSPARLGIIKEKKQASMSPSLTVGCTVADKPNPGLVLDCEDLECLESWAMENVDGLVGLTDYD